MSKKSRRNWQPRSSWSATRAAAVQLAAEFVERYEHNSLLLAHTAAQFQRILELYVRFFTAQGGTERRPALRLACSAYVWTCQPTPPQLGQVVARRRVEEEVHAVRTAETYVLTPGMHAVTVAAAETP